MKKILKEQEPAEPQQLINSEDESESPPPHSATFHNPFDLLDEEDDDGVDQVCVISIEKKKKLFLFECYVILVKNYIVNFYFVELLPVSISLRMNKTLIILG